MNSTSSSTSSHFIPIGREVPSAKRIKVSSAQNSDEDSLQTVFRVEVRTYPWQEYKPVASYSSQGIADRVAFFVSEVFIRELLGGIDVLVTRVKLKKSEMLRREDYSPEIFQIRQKADRNKILVKEEDDFDEYQRLLNLEFPEELYVKESVPEENQGSVSERSYYCLTVNHNDSPDTSIGAYLTAQLGMKAMFFIQRIKPEGVLSGMIGCRKVRGSVVHLSSGKMLTNQPQVQNVKIVDYLDRTEYQRLLKI